MTLNYNGDLPFMVRPFDGLRITTNGNKSDSTYPVELDPEFSSHLPAPLLAKYRR